MIGKEREMTRETDLRDVSQMLLKPDPVELDGFHYESFSFSFAS